MLDALTRLQMLHDWRLILLSLCICMLASFAGVTLLRHVERYRTSSRLLWLIAAGVVTGGGVWAAHFIAILAFMPGFGLSFDLSLTIATLLTSAVVVTLGFIVAGYGHAIWASLLGGAIVGVNIIVAYRLSVLALKMPATMTWAPDRMMISAGCAILFSVLAMIAVRRRSLSGAIMAGLLLGFAVVSHYVVSISTMDLVRQSSFEIDTPWFSPVALSIWIALIAISMVAASFVSAISHGRSRSKIEEHNKRLNAALENLVQGLCMFGPDNRLQLWNQRYVSMFNIPPDKMRVGHTPEDMYALRESVGTMFKGVDAYCNDLQSSFSNGAVLRHVVELPDGRIISMVGQRIGSGGWVATHEDITERRRSEERIEYLAQHDPLTGLPNRIAFNDHLAGVWRDAAEHDRAFTIMSLDIDRFSEINDSYSHATGDAFLCEVARRLASACDGAFIARLGGDEFTIISSDGPQPVRAGDICTRALAAFATPFLIDGHAIVSGCTVGVSIFPQDGVDVETLVTNADIALYRAKKEERGSVRFFEPEMDRELREKRAMLRDLDGALANQEFELHFQPQSHADGTLFGFEALVRWRHPLRGLVSPGIFIPLAEETGLITKIDEWILRAVCTEAATWANPLSVAVNVSPISFRDSDLPSVLHQILLETGLDPRRLEIEITEGVLIENFARAGSLLRRIKDQGVRLSMDDFGSGYSSLSYLQAFPFDKIKIDQTFVAQIDKNAQSSAIIRAIIGLGHALNLRVIAEGVETEQQFAFLADAGCSEMQGYLLGRPQPITSFERVVHLVEGDAERLAG